MLKQGSLFPHGQQPQSSVAKSQAEAALVADGAAKGLNFGIVPFFRLQVKVGACHTGIWSALGYHLQKDVISINSVLLGLQIPSAEGPSRSINAAFICCGSYVLCFFVFISFCSCLGYWFPIERWALTSVNK